MHNFNITNGTRKSHVYMLVSYATQLNEVLHTRLQKPVLYGHVYGFSAVSKLTRLKTEEIVVVLTVHFEIVLNCIWPFIRHTAVYSTNKIKQTLVSLLSSHHRTNSSHSTAVPLTILPYRNSFSHPQLNQVDSRRPLLWSAVWKFSYAPFTDVSWSVSWTAPTL